MNKLLSVLWSDPPKAKFGFEYGGKEIVETAEVAWTKPPEWDSALTAADAEIKQRASNNLYEETHR
jgi:hypothetical protein